MHQYVASVIAVERSNGRSPQHSDNWLTPESPARLGLTIDMYMVCGDMTHVPLNGLTILDRIRMRERFTSTVNSKEFVCCKTFGPQR